MPRVITINRNNDLDSENNFYDESEDENEQLEHNEYFHDYTPNSARIFCITFHIYFLLVILYFFDLICH